MLIFPHPQRNPSVLAAQQPASQCHPSRAGTFSWDPRSPPAQPGRPPSASLGREAATAADFSTEVSASTAEIIFSGLKLEVGAAAGFGPRGGLMGSDPVGCSRGG